MERVSMKLASLVLVACASFLVPFAAEARNKKHACPPISTPPPPSPLPAPAPAIAPYQIHGCGFKCSDSNDCDWPCTVCCANQTCCFEEPFILSPPPPPPPVLSPAPTPYQIHGCGYKCSDSNDCDWPCTYCCWQNQTCCNEPSFERR